MNDPYILLENIQDIKELHNIIVFQTGHSVEKIASNIAYSRPHLAVILKNGGSDEVESEVRKRLRDKYKSEIEQFVSRWSQVPAQVSKDERMDRLEVSLNAVQKTLIGADARQQAALELLIAVHSGAREGRTVEELLDEWDKRAVKLIKEKQKGTQSGADKKNRAKV